MSNPTAIENAVISSVVPSALRPYAKALVLAVPVVGTAWATLVRGTPSPVTVIDFVIAVLGVLGVYFVPLLKGKWESGLKTGVAAGAAVLTAAVAALGNGGVQGWIAFAAAALGAVLVEVVDNVPNAAPVIRAVETDVKAFIAQVPPLPSAGQVDPEH